MIVIAKTYRMETQRDKVNKIQLPEHLIASHLALKRHWIFLLCNKLAQCLDPGCSSARVQSNTSDSLWKLFEPENE